MTTRGTLPDRCGTFMIGGRTVTRLGLGTAQMSESRMWSHPKDVVEAAQVLREALSPYPDDLLLMVKGGQLPSPGGQWEPIPRPSFLRKQVEARLW